MIGRWEMRQGYDWYEKVERDGEKEYIRHVDVQRVEMWLWEDGYGKREYYREDVDGEQLELSMIFWWCVSIPEQDIVLLNILDVSPEEHRDLIGYSFEYHITPKEGQTYKDRLILRTAGGTKYVWHRIGALEGPSPYYRIYPKRVG